MCGVGCERFFCTVPCPYPCPSYVADRRPIDPPPIIQLRVIDKRTRQPPAQPDVDDGDPNYAHSFLQNPYYFMFASLAKPDDDAELHWLKVCTPYKLNVTCISIISEGWENTLYNGICGVITLSPQGYRESQ